MNDFRKSQSRWTELAWVYAVTLLVTGIASAIQGTVAWLDGYLLVIAAATFLYLPLEIITRRGDNPADYGIHRKSILRATFIALMLCAIVFPPYSIGFHLWQTEVVGQAFKPEKARFDRWPMSVRGIPARRIPAEGQVHVFHQNDRFWFSWHLKPKTTIDVKTTTDGSFDSVEGGWRTHGEELRLTKRKPQGRATVETTGQHIAFELSVNGKPIETDDIRVGAAFTAADSNPLRVDRGYFWILELLLVQLILVALPEEVFFRGYLQTSIDRLWGRDRKILGVDFNLHSAILVSALFAIGHFVTIPNPARLAVFFPSLLFGWLRRASGGVTTPIIFHAACNLYVELALVYYQAP